VARRSDPVSPELRAAVIAVDGDCVAPRIGADTPCNGRLTIDHVKSHPRLGKRAESDMDHLVTVCEGHSEGGARAGYQWNTANRPALRAYIADREARAGGVR
jgi:hypothetical protein